jgi:uncharacterized protein YtpQ (UPF0354 family)
MLVTSWKKFEHPAGVYHLEFPSHWDQVQQDEARSCGFGPHERDDVGLWLSILPMSVDTERLAEELPKVMTQALGQVEAGPLRRDETLHHHALVADVKKEGEGGHYWIVCGGDVVLFASTQVPAVEREQWNPAFQRMMASLRITRDDELLWRQIANEVLLKLREQRPDEKFEHDEKGIRGEQQLVHLSNLVRQVKASPGRRAEIIDHFVSSLGQSTADDVLGPDEWEQARGLIVPVLKTKDYIKEAGPRQDPLSVEWLADVVICYALRIRNLLRLVTNWDVRRWGTDNAAVHEAAMDNLTRLPWPSRLEGSRQPQGGRVILVETGDSLASSRLLHPELHRLFSGPLGNPFWAGIPDRDTLVLFSDRRTLKQRIGRRLRTDSRTSPYPITARPFLVTRDGIAPG